MIKKIWLFFTLEKKIIKFRYYLIHDINLGMIEFMKGKSLRGIKNNKEWNDLVLHCVDFLIPKFTYKEWLKILNAYDFYQKSSNNKELDIRINLENLLKCHYIEIYKSFDMKTYGEYQMKNKLDLKKLVLINGAINPLTNKKADIVFMLYKNDSRMCYDVKSKERVMLENFVITGETIIITLVDVARCRKFININL